MFGRKRQRFAKGEHLAFQNSYEVHGITCGLQVMAAHHLHIFNRTSSAFCVARLKSYGSTSCSWHAGCR